MNWSSRRINAIASINEAEHYLEIGVATGKTFEDVNIKFKDGVDPNFGFDTAKLASDRDRFFSQRSDDFWISDQPKIYDVIMIDGLHTFEQTFRDILCSMRFSHTKTVWLIDDTLPSDVFSAIPNQQRSYSERRKMKIEGIPWHGDVYKIVPAVHDFLPILSYVTIVNSGNPQTLAWYAPRSSFKPQANNLEAISRMTFFDIEPNIKIFNLVDEETAMKLLKSSLSSYAEG